MELIKEKWTNKDIKELQDYLMKLGNEERREWSKNLIRTELPVICIKTKDMYYVIDEIAKGNYLSFLDLMVWEYYENTAINGYLICKIKDFDTFKKYLDIYSQKADNWATCDLLKFNNKGNEEKYFELATKYCHDSKPFVKRIGMNILFLYIDNDEYIDKIFDIMNLYPEENHYYVNMMNAWLLSECFIKQREKTLKFLKNNKLNKFTINKGIQKCRESRRVSAEDKEMLLQFKVK